MKKSVLLFVLAFFAAISVVAQGSIRGNIKTISVIDENEVIEPLVNAEVYIMYGGVKVRTQTNNHGDYTLRPVEPGTYSVTINSILIDTITMTGVVVSGTGMAMVQDLTVPLGRQMTVVVIRPNETIRDETPSKSELKGTDLDKLPDPGSLNHAIELMGGVWVSDNGRQISFRGARIGDALYIVDGVRQRGTDVSLPNRSIATLSAYHGGIPAEYGDFMGGVVVIETMSYFDWENQQEVKRLLRRKQQDAERFQEQLRLREQRANPIEPVPSEEIEEEQQI